MTRRSTRGDDPLESIVDNVVEAAAVADRLDAPGLRPTEVKAQGVKPLMRGWIDVAAALFAAPASAMLMAEAQPGASTVAAIVYGASLFLLFAVSASYHTPMWPVAVRETWRKIDHSMIYVLIAGSYTPFCLAVLPRHIGVPMLICVWVAAAGGWLKSFVWTKAPRVLNTLVYNALGWLVVPFLPELYAGLGFELFATVAFGGLLYTIGGVVYARRYPNPSPTIFGYHEVFHLFVVGGAACHFYAAWQLLI